MVASSKKLCSQEPLLPATPTCPFSNPAHEVYSHLLQVSRGSIYLPSLECNGTSWVHRGSARTSVEFEKHDIDMVTNPSLPLLHHGGSSNCAMAWLGHEANTESKEETLTPFHLVNRSKNDEYTRTHVR